MEKLQTIQKTIVEVRTLSEIDNLKTTAQKFKAGKLSQFYLNWKKYTTDKFILETIHNGLKLDFADIPIDRNFFAHPISNSESKIIDIEIEKLLNKKVVMESPTENLEFISGVFTREKKDGTKRMILNLKHFNTHINYKHFKIESIQNVLNVVKPNAFMASIDLKDAFYSVPIYKEHQKYLKFFHKKLYKFVCLPNGYGPAMRVFTKITKVPFSHLRKNGHISVVFVDDSYLQSNTYEECMTNIHDTVKLLELLGFTIHPNKSILTPTQNITFLGFDINTIKMTITLTYKKKEKIKYLCETSLSLKSITVRNLATVIGNLVAAFPSVTYGKLHYRHLEAEKIAAVKYSKQNFDSTLILTKKSKLELLWWKNNILDSYHKIHLVSPDKIIFTDASMQGWGATDNKTSSGGLWKEYEISHINELEMKAIFIGIRLFCKNRNFQHVKVMCDNMTAIAYINHMGGTKSSTCNEIAKLIWEWCINNNLWVSAAHIPGRSNIEADLYSRKYNSSTEWQLNPKLFNKIINIFGKPSIDLFASRINKQIEKYVSWQPEPEAWAVDSFSINWNNYYYYIFPPFSMIGQTTAKILRDNTHAILVVPDWPTQYWYPAVISLSNIKPLILEARKDNLLMPSNIKEVHPLARKMRLLVIKRVPGS